MAVIDSFNRPNADLDGSTADNGATWDVLAGTVAIASNTATPTAGSPSATAALPYGAHTTFDLSLTVSVTSGSANPAGLLFRILDNSNRLGCFLAITTQRAQIFKADGGTTTLLAEAPVTIATSTTYTVRARGNGAAIEMFVDGVSIVSFTLTGGDETQYTAANGYTSIGFRGDTTAVFDNLTDNNQALTVTGIASGAAFGTAVVSQRINGTGIASGAAFGSAVVTQGQTIAAFGIASLAAVGSHTVSAFPFLRQTGYEFIPGEQLTFNTQFDGSTAIAENLIVHALAGDVDIGTITRTGTGWSVPVNLHYTDMTLNVAWKVAAGGEPGASGSFTQGNFSGSQSFVLEYSSPLAGSWVVKGSATNPTDGTNVTAWPSGTTGSLVGDGIAVAAFAVGAVLSNSADTVSNGYTLRFTQGAGVFEAGLWVADKNVLGGTTTTTTLTRAAPVTADQTHGSVVVFGKAVPQTVTPTGIASAAAVGSAVLFGIYPVGIASAAAFGTATVAVATVLPVGPTGIPSGQAFGQHVVFIGFLIRCTGIASTQAFGTATVAYPARLFKAGQFDPDAIFFGEDLVSEIFYGEDPVWQ